MAARQIILRAPQPVRVSRSLSAAAGLLLVGAAAAQDAAPAVALAKLLPAGLPFTVVPSVGATAVLSSNDDAAQGARRSELSTQLSSGIRINSGAGPVRGSLDYSLTAVAYARESRSSELQQALSAAGTAELIDRRLFVDATAAISQQPISPLGPRFVDNSQSRANSTEVRSYTLTPRLTGQLAGLVDYDARLSHSATHNGASSGADNRSSLASLSLGGRASFSRFGWSFSAMREDFGFGGDDDRRSDRLSAGLTFAPVPELNLSTRVGRESTDLGGGVRRADSTFGAGAVWRPTPITSLRADIERRPFGNTHQLLLTHRSPRTVWSYTDSRDVYTGAAQSLVEVLTIRDLFLQQLAAQQPGLSVGEREREVDVLLQQRNIDRDGLVVNEFLVTAATVQRRQTVSIARLGMRNSVSLSLTQGSTSSLATSSGSVFEFANARSVRERSINLSVSHQLTPVSSLSLAASHLRTAADSAAATRLSSFDLTWSSRVGVRTRATISARHSVFSSASDPYTESALTAGLSMTF